MVPRGEGSEAAVTQTENTNKAKKISPEKVTLHGGEEWNRTERRGEEWKNREGQNRGGGPPCGDVIFFFTKRPIAVTIQKNDWSQTIAKQFKNI